MEAVIKAVVLMGVSAVVTLLEAQIIIWGLSLYHVSSGIWPVWLIGSGFEGILSMGVASGIRAVKRHNWQYTS